MDEKFMDIRKGAGIFSSLVIIGLSILFYVFCCFAINAIFLWIPSVFLLRHNVNQNKDVEKIEITEMNMAFPFYKHNVEIWTKDGYKILLKDVDWTAKNKGIKIYQIKDIGCFGGTISEIKKKRQTEYDAADIAIFGKLAGKKMKSVSDIVDNRKDLYNLFKAFEPKSRHEFSQQQTEFVYNGKFIIKADFAKEGSQIFDFFNDDDFE